MDDALLTMGNLYLEELDQPLEAEKNYQKLLAIYPQNEFAQEVTYHLGLAYFRQAKWEQAQKVFEEIRTVRGAAREDEPPTELDRLITACERKQPLTLKRPHYAGKASNWIELGDTLFTAKKYPEALNAYGKVVRARPLSEEAAYSLVQMEGIAASSTTRDVELKVSYTTPNENKTTEDRAKLTVLDVHPKAHEIYSFAGHDNDITKLKVEPSGSTYVWSLKSTTPNLGTFDTPTSKNCKFKATATGKNQLQLQYNGKVVWTNALEVLPITSRAAWGADAPNLSGLEGMASISKVTVHHSSNTATGAAEVQRIQDYHMSNYPYWLTGNGWADIGYHFLQGQDGTVFEGRQLEGLSLSGGSYTKGSHVEGNNTAAGIGLCLLGDYETSGQTTFTEERRLFLEKVLTAICRRYNLTASSDISYHQSMALPGNSTACPGARIIPEMDTIKSHVTGNLK